MLNRKYYKQNPRERKYKILETNEGKQERYGYS